MDRVRVTWTDVNTNETAHKVLRQERAADGSWGDWALVADLGAARVIDYTREDFTRTGQTYDLILDMKTDRSAFAYQRAKHQTGIASLSINDPIAALFLRDQPPG